MSEEKTHPEHKHSVTFVTKVGTINMHSEIALACLANSFHAIFRFLKKIFLTRIENFCESHHPTRHLKQKVTDFAAIYKSITANKLPLTNLEQFLRRIKSPLTC